MRFVAGAGSDTSLKIGALLEFSLILANIATAVVLYPLVKRQSQILSLGYVTARVMETVFIAIGLISIVSVLSVNDALRGASAADAAALAVQGNTLVSVYDWAFRFGPGLVVGFGNGLMLGYLMYRSGLVPRRLAMVGLIGGPLLILAFVLVLFGAFDVGSSPQALLTLPEAAWELLLGIYAAWKGFKHSPTVESQRAIA